MFFGLNGNSKFRDPLRVQVARGVNLLKRPDLVFENQGLMLVLTANLSRRSFADWPITHNSQFRVRPAYRAETVWFAPL